MAPGHRHFGLLEQIERTDDIPTKRHIVELVSRIRVDTEVVDGRKHARLTINYILTRSRDCTDGLSIGRATVRPFVHTYPLRGLHRTQPTWCPRLDRPGDVPHIGISNIERARLMGHSCRGWTALNVASTRHPRCSASDYSREVLVVPLRCAIGRYCRSRAPV